VSLDTKKLCWVEVTPDTPGTPTTDPVPPVKILTPGKSAGAVADDADDADDMLRILALVPVAAAGGLTDNPIAADSITYLSSGWSVSTPGTPGPATDCTFQSDTDYHPQTFFGQYAVPSKEMCCGLCDAHDSCKVSTFAHGQCYLKAAADASGGSYEHKGVYSCVKSANARAAAEVVPLGIGPTTIPATVPGDLLTDLQSAGLIADPLHGLNFLNASMWTANTWTYKSSFSTTADGSSYVLVFDGIKMGASIKVSADSSARE
jgi:hypothetical protein